ncbi:hypothetical protein OXB_0119 [Bacillus sp. OxB-1]|nr:hypothetical protein OXB_0119 [Bacillus sp. OxB-1]
MGVFNGGGEQFDLYTGFNDRAKKLPLIFGYLFTGYGFVAGILGPSISGLLVDKTNNNYMIVFGYLSLLSLLAAVMIYFVNPRKMKPSTT